MYVEKNSTFTNCRSVQTTISLDGYNVAPKVNLMAIPALNQAPVQQRDPQQPLGPPQGPAPLGVGAVPDRMMPGAEPHNRHGFFEKCVLEFKKLLLSCVRLVFEFCDTLREMAMPPQPPPVQPQAQPAPQ